MAALRIDNRYLPPLLITAILLGAHAGFGILEGLPTTGLAIATCIATEALFARLAFATWPHLASAYISGISVGILVRSPLVWPFAVTAALSILSKYAIRMREGHLFNPSNFGICAMLLLYPGEVAILSFQWGNAVWAMLVIWALGARTIHKLRRFHICAAYVLGYFALNALRCALTGRDLIAGLAPITGPMYQLFIFFMITDPKTTLSTRRGQVGVALGVAAAEAILRALEVVNAPFFALFLVGPPALIAERLLRRRAGRAVPDESAAAPVGHAPPPVTPCP